MVRSSGTPEATQRKEAPDGSLFVVESRDEGLLLRLHERAQAARADVQADRLAADVDALLLHIRLERAGFLDGLALPAAAMGMADVPAEHSRFRANVAGATCHA